MKRIIFLIVLSFSISVNATGENNLLKYAEKFKSHLLKPRLEGLNHQRFQYVFVGGFLNEALYPLYFGNNIDTLEEIGIASGDIHYVAPWSSYGLRDSVTYLNQKFSSIIKKNPNKKLVIIAHSKGALESLAGLVTEYDKLGSQVQALFLVQGAVLGSEIADCILEDIRCEDMADEVPLINKIMFSATVKIGRLLKAFGLSKGLQSIQRDHSSEIGKIISQVMLSKKVSKKTFYIIARQNPGSMSPFVGSTGYYLQSIKNYSKEASEYTGEPLFNNSDSDGFVATRSQYLKGFGHILALLDADHGDLVVRWPVGDWSSSLKKKMTQAIVSFSHSLKEDSFKREELKIKMP